MVKDIRATGLIDALCERVTTFEIDIVAEHACFNCPILDNQLLKSLFIAVEILKCSRNFDPVLKDPCVRRTSESRFQIEIWIVLFSCHLTGMIVSPKDC
jgi:hypothetical protein